MAVTASQNGECSPVATMAHQRSATASQLASLVTSILVKPHDVHLHIKACALLCDLGSFEDAVGAGLVAVELAPHNACAQGELGRALFLAGHLDHALSTCALATSLAPRNVGILVTFGAALFALGHVEAALEAAADAVAIDPGQFQARANLALALEAVGRLDEAEYQSRRALTGVPDSFAGQHNLAGLRLSRGLLDAESWRLYEARFGMTTQSALIGQVPRWTGADISGKTMLLHAEQGYGDTIQFARYAPMVKARGARVILAVAPPLIRLMQTLDGVDEVVAAGSLPPFDVFCPLASLPGVFDTRLETIPAGIPYLAADPEAGVKPRRLSSRHLQVGLAWAGNPGFIHDRARSIDAVEFRGLEEVAGVQFHSLQKDSEPPFPMMDRMAGMTDFADTAALIAGLDLVITVDTAVAHLAGALGKPVWLLSRFLGCWRWLKDRSDSPWYPTMRIFRQERQGGWAPVLASVRSELANLSAQASPD